MPLDWQIFDQLSGNKNTNFENLCRALVRSHFGKFGQFTALKNQAGIEFMLNLSMECPLGNSTQCFGWQCKVLDLTQAGDLRSSGKNAIKDSFEKTLKYFPEVTDWVLWTPYTLSKQDQDWFFSLETTLTLHTWNQEEVDSYLSGPGLLLRNTYFGELVLTPEELDLRHRDAIQPIKNRWLETVHQQVGAERLIRRMLGEPFAWAEIEVLGENIGGAIRMLRKFPNFSQDQTKALEPFLKAGEFFSRLAKDFYKTLGAGKFEIVKQELERRKTCIDYFPATLTPLFENYIKNAADRIADMPNLEYSYSQSDITTAIYKLGLKLWENRVRELEENDLKQELPEKYFISWNSNIINLLAQEGIVFRNQLSEPDCYSILPTFDALGGYIIANALMKRYLKDDDELTWCKSDEFEEALIGKQSHPLAWDILRILIALVPRYLNGVHLWTNLQGSLRETALKLSTEIESKYIDSETLSELLNLYKTESRLMELFYKRLLHTRASQESPLNADFLDTMLRGQSVSERDLSWSEWIRKTRDDRLSDLHSLETSWKEKSIKPSASDRLRMKWVMWYLTSTDRLLRDLATRALYWFGRLDPCSLFLETVASLKINDPYVPERMLAASYGVNMALSDGSNMESSLKSQSEFARELFKLMFADDAEFVTTHELMREYAFRIIELALHKDSKLLSKSEQELLKVPFKHHECISWGEMQSTENSKWYQTPFDLDFEKETLGSLGEGWSPYDHDNQAYLKVRNRILWRVRQLGWSHNEFEEVERAIDNDYHYRLSGNTIKIDRYGEKYSWIAFFEMAGYLRDQEKLELWAERTSKVDIDPSFPEKVTQGKVITKSILGDTNIILSDWIKGGGTPEIEPYLLIDTMQNIDGPWLALDGFVYQQDEYLGRSSFCFIRSFLVEDKDIELFHSHLENQDLSGRWLPDKPKFYYTFAGEIPWCQTYPENGQTEFKFPINPKRVIVRREVPTFFEGEKDINGSVSMGFRLETKDVQEIQYEYACFKGTIPVCHFGWEGYQSASSKAGQATTLAKEIAQGMDLVSRAQSFDLYTKQGQSATLNVSDHSDSIRNQQNFFFVKEDLMNRYLTEKHLSLVWGVWGKREYSLKQAQKLFHGPNPPKQRYGEFSFTKIHYKNH